MLQSEAVGKLGSAPRVMDISVSILSLAMNSFVTMSRVTENF